MSAAQAQDGVLSPGDTVAVLDADVPGHIRTPFYVRGKRGECGGRKEGASVHEFSPSAGCRAG